MVEGAPIEVTVVTVVRNAVSAGRTREFVQSMASVQMQANVRAEHLIVDGASDDGTLELIGTLPSDRIPRVVSSARDSGIYDAMNRGFRLARGKYVIFLNSDDYYCDPQGLAECARALDVSGAVFSYAPTIVRTERNGHVVDMTTKMPDVRRIFLHMSFSHQSMMVRRDAALAIGGFDVRYRCAADYDFVLRLVFSGAKACEVTRRFVVFRSGGFSGLNRELARQENGLIFSRLYSPYMDGGLSPEEGARMRGNALPVPLLNRLHVFYRHAFEGDESKPNEPQTYVPYSVLHELARFKFTLLALKGDCSVRKQLCSIATAAFRHPFWGVALTVAYCRARRHAPDGEVLRTAYERFAARIRERAARAVGEGVKIAADDYWNVLGAYYPEPWGVWAPRKLFVRVKVPACLRGKDLVAVAWLGRYSPDDSEHASVRVCIGLTCLATFELDGPVPMACGFSVPGALSDVDEFLVECAVERDYCPCECGCGNDNRRLGISFSGLTLKGI